MVDEIPKLAAWIGTGEHEVDLAGHGEYLMEVRPGDGDERLITAVSLDPAQEAVARETAIVAALTALALLITALGTIAIVRFALRPLGRVASTAAEVATLPLDRDHHAISPRVPGSRLSNNAASDPACSASAPARARTCSSSSFKDRPA